MKMGIIKTTALLALAIVLVGAEASARIKLAALPQRERVEIQLDNGNFTLVEEERIVPLLQSTARGGNNMIDFSWSNTQIDKDSIQFRPIAIREGGKFRPIEKVNIDGGGSDEVSVINVSYPPGENALVWEVFASEAADAKASASWSGSSTTRMPRPPPPAEAFTTSGKPSRSPTVAASLSSATTPPLQGVTGTPACSAISFEEISLRPEEALSNLFCGLGIRDGDLDALVDLVDPPRLSRWVDYATDDWFAAREARCEALLADWLRSEDAMVAPTEALSGGLGNGAARRRRSFVRGSRGH